MKEKIIKLIHSNVKMCSKRSQITKIRRTCTGFIIAAGLTADIEDISNIILL